MREGGRPPGRWFRRPGGASRMVSAMVLGVFWCGFALADSRQERRDEPAPDPRDPGTYDTAVIDLEDGCDYDLDLEASIEWSDPDFGYTTPQTIQFGDHDYTADSDVRCPGRPAEKVDMRVRVHYPGTDGAVASGGSFPLVVFYHGQQYFNIAGFEGYDYLGELLASHGFIVASIDARSLLDSTIKSRGEHIREHLRRFVARNAEGSGSMFEGQLDLSDVVLVGHSRGGDAIVAAWEWQRVAPDEGYGIGGLVAIAPVQFFGYLEGEPTFISHLRNVPYQIIHGSRDGDVSDFQGLRQYDRAAHPQAEGETLKSMVFVKDANHNYFNTTWERYEGDDYCCGSTLKASVQQDLAKVYVHAFVEVVIHRDPDYLGYLNGGTPNPVSSTTVALDFQAPADMYTLVEHFQEPDGEPHEAYVNAIGGDVEVAPEATAATYTELELYAEQAPPWGSYPGETWAGIIEWTSPSIYFTAVPSEAMSTFHPKVQDYLSFRVGQVYRAYASVNPAEQNQDFRVRLYDSRGNVSPWVQVSTFASIFPPWMTSEGGIKTIMSVVRMPLPAFTNIYPGYINGIEFQFGVVSSGELVFDDIRFTR